MRYLHAVSALLLISSCINDNLQEQYTEPSCEGNDILTCLLDGQVLSRTSLASDHTPVWNDGDAISVFSPGGRNNCFVLTSGAGAATGSFRGNLPSGNTLFALYPYKSGNSCSSSQLNFSLPQVQTCREGDYSGENNVMACAFSHDTPELRFKNVFGILELQLSGTASIGRIELESYCPADMLWGDFSLSINGNQGTDSQTLTARNGNNSVSISFNTAVKLVSNRTKSFYFILPAGTLSQGFCLDIYDGSGNLICTKATNKDQTIHRSRIKVLPAISDVNIPSDSYVRPEPFSWAAYNNLGRTGSSDRTVIDPQTSGYPLRSARQDRYVGMFYFIWHNSFSGAGYEPHDNQARLGPGVYDYQTGWAINSWCYPCLYPHYWGKPYLDYYRDDDSWVLRKHAQMLSDAGVDFICFDATNNSFYEGEVLNLCRIFKEIRADGGNTPQITFMVWHSRGAGSELEYANFNHDVAVTTLFNNIYSHTEYSDLWFKWEGKPLMLARGEDVTNAAVKNFFTFRRCWYLWNNNWQTGSDAGDPWWQGSTEDKWPWGCCYTDDVTNTMKAGTHNGVNECVSVSPATHPISNIGRSFQIGNDWQSYRNHPGTVYPKDPSKGTYFKQQFAAARNLDPKVLFFTGWNEFLAGHSQAPTVLQFPYMGGKAADYIFVDQYNNEFSRDIEPISGDFGDNYYYYMADFIRQFKGVDETPVFSTPHSISIDGKFADWLNIESCYADDKGDNKWRGYDTNHGNGSRGFNTNTVYVNRTGRNDLLISKVANDGVKLYFYISAAGDITGYSEGVNGLNLFLAANAGSINWEGFNFMLSPTSATKASLYRSAGAWNWERISADIDIAVSGKAMEVAVPLSLLGLSGAGTHSLDFKWVDNVDLSHSDGIQRCMRDGDSAPNGRFRYRYVYNNR